MNLGEFLSLLSKLFRQILLKTNESLKLSTSRFKNIGYEHWYSHPQAALLPTSITREVTQGMDPVTNSAP